MIDCEDPRCLCCHPPTHWCSPPTPLVAGGRWTCRECGRVSVSVRAFELGLVTAPMIRHGVINRNSLVWKVEAR